jgi:hypothetical protein
MKKLLTVLFVLACLVASAQEKKTLFGITSSVDLNSYALIDDFDGTWLKYKGRLSYSVGFLIRQEISERFFVKAGLLYSNKAFSEILDMEKYAAIHQGDPLVYGKEDIKIIHSNRFIDLPVDFQFHRRGRETSVYPILGVVNSFRIGYSNKGNALNDHYEGFRYNDYLLAMKMGLGVQIRGEKMMLMVEPQVRFYLNKVHETWIDKNPVYAGVEVSLFRLSKSN